MASKKLVRIGFTGGGSGGHVYPLLAVAEEFTTSSLPDIETVLYYFGPRDQFETEIRSAGMKPVRIAGPKLRRYASIQNVLDVPKFFWALAQAWWKLFLIMPDAIFSKGGPGAFPVVLMARFYRIPVMIHESDATPGLTNLLSSRFAAKIALSFASAAKYFNPNITIVTGNPVREDLLHDQLAPQTAKKELGFSADHPLIFVLGGSQGSTRLNEFILTNLGSLLKTVQILHVAGRGNFMELQKLTHAALLEVPVEDAAQTRYKLVPYLEKGDLKKAFAAADIVVARGSCGTIFEAAAFGKPMILIPLPESANDHQRANAHEFSKTGAAVVIEESNLFYGIFSSQIQEILTGQGTAGKMSFAARNFARPKAAEEVAEALMKLALRT